MGDFEAVFDYQRARGHRDLQSIAARMDAGQTFKVWESQIE